MTMVEIENPEANTQESEDGSKEVSDDVFAASDATPVDGRQGDVYDGRAWDDVPGMPAMHGENGEAFYMYL